VADCDFTRVGARCVLLNGCSHSRITGNRVAYSNGGFFADDGANNSIDHNDIDLRWRTTGGALIESIAYRWKAIGGDGGDRMMIQGNRCQGASWSIEYLPNDESKRGWCIGNQVSAPMCAMSLGTARWTVQGNVADLASDAKFGLEIPGTAAAILHAQVHGNVIRWRDFSGYIGFGIACNTQYGEITIGSNSIRAPYLIQTVAPATATAARLTIDGVSGEYGCTALFYRSAATVTAKFGHLRPHKPCLPYGNNGQGAVFDIYSGTDLAAEIDLAAEVIEGGIGQILVATKCTALTVRGWEVRGSAAYRTSYLYQITLPAAAARMNLLGMNVVAPHSAMGLGMWCYIAGAAATGTSIHMLRNRWAGAAVPGPATSQIMSASILTGDPYIAVYVADYAGGTMAAGAYVDIGPLYPQFAVRQKTSFQTVAFVDGALTGISVETTVTADHTLYTRLRNISGGALNRPTTTLVQYGERHL
jgi:parallel beta-helix repeat protein